MPRGVSVMRGRHGRYLPGRSWLPPPDGAARFSSLVSWGIFVRHGGHSPGCDLLVDKRAAPWQNPDNPSRVAPADCFPAFAPAGPPPFIVAAGVSSVGRLRPAEGDDYGQEENQEELEYPLLRPHDRHLVPLSASQANLPSLTGIRKVW